MPQFSNPKTLLYSSQLKRLAEENLTTKLTSTMKDKINDSIVEAILVDGRPHGDFRKKGLFYFSKNLN